MTNVEIVKRAWAAWEERDMDLAAADWDPDIEWDLTRFDEAPPDTVVRGAANVMGLIAAWLTTWRAYEVTVESYEPAAAGDALLLMVRRRAREAATGADANRLAAQLWTLEGGRIKRIQSFSDVSEARREAGLTR